MWLSNTLFKAPSSDFIEQQLDYHEQRHVIYRRPTEEFDTKHNAKRPYIYVADTKCSSVSAKLYDKIHKSNVHPGSTVL